jgi:hypothetical protein
MSTSKAHVYAIRHIASGNCYVGCTRNKSQRWTRHRTMLKHGKHHSKRLQSLWDQDGAAAFEFVTIEIFKPESAGSQTEREVHWISLCGSLNSHIANNNRDGFTIRQEDADQQRDAQLSKMNDEPEFRQFRKECGAKLAELARSPEARLAMSANTKRRWQDAKEASRLRSGLARRWEDPEERKKAADRVLNSSPESRAKKALALAKTWADPEKNKTLLESRKKRWADPEAKARHAEKMRQIWAQRRSQID